MHKGQRVVYLANPLLYGAMIVTEVRGDGLLMCDGYTESQQPTQIPGNTYLHRELHEDPQPFQASELELWTVWQARITAEVLAA